MWSSLISMLCCFIGSAVAVECPSEMSSLSQTDKTTILITHNFLRVFEQASNMLAMKWDDFLEKRAHQFAQECVLPIGATLTKSCDGELLGQNVYYDTGSNDSVIIKGIDTWFNEKPDYDFDTKQCNGESCSNYTQMVWHNTDRIGCALVQCPTLQTNWNSVDNAIYYVCNYAPRGNVAGESIYNKGKACSECNTQVSQAWTCSAELCEACIPEEHGDHCYCVERTCQNGGTFMTVNCTCACPRGFHGFECENRCGVCELQDLGEGNCDALKSLCTREIVQNTCPVTCGLCNMPDSCVEEEEEEKEEEAVGTFLPQCLCEDTYEDCKTDVIRNRCYSNRKHWTECPLTCGYCDLPEVCNGCAHRECRNGGTFNVGACSCDCTDDYYGDDCERACDGCVDRNDNCVDSISECNVRSIRDYMKYYCAVTCGLCDLPEKCLQ